MEKLEEVLELKDLEKLKKADLIKSLRSLQHLVKANKKESKQEVISSEGLKYEAISVVGPKLITIKFELDDNKELSTNKAIVVSSEVDTRDTGNQNHMAKYFGIKKLEKLAKSQKEKK